MAATPIPCHCKKRVVKKGSGRLSWMAGLIIAILPKCPFCILAYSSAITMCGAAGLEEHTPVWSSYISIFFALLTFIFIASNFRGWRTVFSMVLVLLGSVGIVWSELMSGSLIQYQWGTFFLLTGIWVNGSFLSIMRKAYSWLSGFHSKFIKKVSLDSEF